MKRVLLIAFLACLAIVAFGWWQHRQSILAARLADVAAADAVEAAVAERIDTADFAGEGRQFADVLDALKARCRVPLIVNQAEAKEMGVDRQTRVDVPAGVFPLGELLDQITSGMDLGWRRAGDCIQITSQSAALSDRTRLFTRIYPLPASSAAGEKLTDDTQQLCDAIEKVIEPDSWDEVGGKGIIETAGGALVVHQTADVHRRVRDFLAQMNGAGLARPVPPGQSAPLGRRQVAQSLEQLGSVDCREQPLDEVLKSLAARQGFKIHFAKEMLSDAAVTPVTKKLAHVSVRTILREILDELKLAYIVRDDTVVVTTRDDAALRLVQSLYDVRDLFRPGDRPNFDELIDLITTTIEPDSWDDVGGPGAIAELGDRWLVISQTQEVQAQVQRLLAQMRAILAPGLDPAGDAQAAVEDISPAVREALDREVRLTYTDRPIGEVCAELTIKLGIPLIVKRGSPRHISGRDWAFEKDDGQISYQVPVTIDLPQLPMRDALPLLLAPLRMDLDVEGEVISLPVPFDLDRKRLARVIDVRHLLDVGGGITEDTLDDLITNCVAPDSWDEVGGPGMIVIYRGLLVVSQSYEIQRQVQALIDALSEHCLPAPPTVASQPEGTPPQGPIWIGLTTRERQILDKLMERSSLHITKSRIDAAIRALCQRHGIPVVIDRRWQDEAESDVFWPVLSLEIDDAPLGDILARLLTERDSGMTVMHGVLYITSRESAESHVLPRLYYLGRRATDGQPLKPAEVKSLLTDRVDPDTWDERGGQGVIGIISSEWLLVRQTLPIHRRVEEALAKLRAGETLPIPPEEAGVFWNPLASPPIQAVWRLMKRAIPGGSQ